MDLQPRTEIYVQDDRSWLDSEHGTDATVSVTLDVAQFVEATHFPNGFIPSGTPLGVVTATGLAGPYDNAAGDGRGTLIGHLYAQVKVKKGATRIGGALLRHGFIKRNKLPFPVDAAGEADVKGFIGYRTA